MRSSPPTRPWFQPRVDERGVVLREGKDAIPGVWLTIIHPFLLVSLVAMLPILKLHERGFVGALHHWGYFVAVVGMIVPLLWWERRLYLLRKEIKDLRAVNSLAAQFGTDAERLEQVAVERRLKPRYKINGIDYYDLQDFGDLAVLLRPAASPDAQSLLLPAKLTVTSDPQLLMASEQEQTT